MSNFEFLIVKHFTLCEKRLLCALTSNIVIVFFRIVRLSNLTNQYSYVFIDEAGQSTEPEALIAFNIIHRYGDNKCQVVIAGDPQQLGPGIRSKYAVPLLSKVHSNMIHMNNAIKYF